MWDLQELDQATLIARDIDRHDGPCPINSGVIVLSASKGVALGREVHVKEATVIRHLYAALGFDEAVPFIWRVEHKLIQAHILNHYCPGSVSPSIGLKRAFATAGAQHLRKYLSELYAPSGYIIKPALGECSGLTGTVDHSAAVWAAIDAEPGRERPQGVVLDKEEFLVQRRVPIAMEYRVHSLGDAVIQGLTFRRYRLDHSLEELEAPALFVQAVLNRIPNVLRGLLAWDVARTADDQFVIIEVNVSGFHPVFKRGFQTSGYFLDPGWGPLLMSRLFQHVEEHYRAPVEIALDVSSASDIGQIYQRVKHWHLLLGTINRIMQLPASTHSVDWAATGTADSYIWDSLFFSIVNALRPPAATIATGIESLANPERMQTAIQEISHCEPYCDEAV